MCNGFLRGKVQCLKNFDGETHVNFREPVLLSVRRFESLSKDGEDRPTVSGPPSSFLPFRHLPRSVSLPGSPRPYRPDRTSRHAGGTNGETRHGLQGDFGRLPSSRLSTSAINAPPPRRRDLRVSLMHHKPTPAGRGPPKEQGETNYALTKSNVLLYEVSLLRLLWDVRKSVQTSERRVSVGGLGWVVLGAR